MKEKRDDDDDPNPRCQNIATVIIALIDTTKTRYPIYKDEINSDNDPLPIGSVDDARFRFRPVICVPVEYLHQKCTTAEEYTSE